MACFWMFVSHLLLLLPYQFIALGNAHDIAPLHAEQDSDLTVSIALSDDILVKRSLVSRFPQDSEAGDSQSSSNSNTSTTNDGDNSDQSQDGTDTDGSQDTSNDDQSSTDGQDSSTTSGEPQSTDSSSNDTSTTDGNSSDGQGSSGTPDQDGSDDDYSARGDEPVTDYQPAIPPIENDADYASHDGEVMNTMEGGDYQYHLIDNADANGDTISLPDEYNDYDTSTFLKCTSLCNDWNTKHGNTVVCQAVSYYGNGECYPLTNLYQDEQGRYAYSVPGSTLGLVLRNPTYPTPTEPSPSEDDAEDYTTTSMTTSSSTDVYTTAVLGPSSPSPQVTYAVKTITPANPYDKTTVEVYISSCQTSY